MLRTALAQVCAVCPLWLGGFERYRDAPTIVLNEDQLLCCVLAAGSSRRQIDNPGAPSANAPRVTGSGVWLLRAAVGSASSDPLVAPAMIALPGTVS
jgi:hypothetical protein